MHELERQPVGRVMREQMSAWTGMSLDRLVEASPRGGPTVTSGGIAFILKAMERFQRV